MKTKYPFSQELSGYFLKSNSHDEYWINPRSTLIATQIAAVICCLELTTTAEPTVYVVGWIAAFLLNLCLIVAFMAKPSGSRSAYSDSDSVGLDVALAFNAVLWSLGGTLLSVESGRDLTSLLIGATVMIAVSCICVGVKHSRAATVYALSIAFSGGYLFMRSTREMGPEVLVAIVASLVAGVVLVLKSAKSSGPFQHELEPLHLSCDDIRKRVSDSRSARNQAVSDYESPVCDVVQVPNDGERRVYRDHNNMFITRSDKGSSQRGFGVRRTSLPEGSCPTTDPLSEENKSHQGTVVRNEHWNRFRQEFPAKGANKERKAVGLALSPADVLSACAGELARDEFERDDSRQDTRAPLSRVRVFCLHCRDSVYASMVRIAHFLNTGNPPISLDQILDIGLDDDGVQTLIVCEWDGLSEKISTDILEFFKSAPSNATLIHIAKQPDIEEGFSDRIVWVNSQAPKEELEEHLLWIVLEISSDRRMDKPASPQLHGIAGSMEKKVANA